MFCYNGSYGDVMLLHQPCCSFMCWITSLLHGIGCFLSQMTVGPKDRRVLHARGASVKYAMHNGLVGGSIRKFFLVGISAFSAFSAVV